MSLTKFESIKQKLDLCDAMCGVLGTPTVDDLYLPLKIPNSSTQVRLFFISDSTQEAV